ncbi:MAG: DUF368 domain-containing protein [Thermodesulfobacteriota bacterium]
MQNRRVETWKAAFFNSPGPRTPREAAVLYAKGLCMGSADVVPGVSGGTIALITGIYEQILSAIKSFNAGAVRRLLALDLHGVLSVVHARFLIVLLAGIGTAILSFARLMNWLLVHQPVFTWSLFFGLIAASILVVGRKVSRWRGGAALSCFLGAVTGWVFVSLIPVSTPEALWFIFISGFVAICAMILPGISGAFLLLVLGKYVFITGALKNPFSPENLLVIVVFCAGCVAGLLCFSRVLSYLLTRWHNITMAFLTGLMAGSMKKIWPWKEPLEVMVLRDKVHVLREANVLPQLDRDLVFALLLAVTGFVLVLVLEHLSREKQ